MYVLFVVMSQRRLFNSERAAHTYHSLAFFASIMTVELVIGLLVVVLTVTPVYWIAKLHVSAASYVHVIARDNRRGDTDIYFL